MKYIIVTGSVMSGIGKGITASSIGVVLQSNNLNVTAIKIDPYLNMDCGTMSPFEHGECYVLDDGAETDLDLGNYERFLDINLTSRHNITTGKIYSQVIQQERDGKFLGKTVQIIPHITDAIKTWIRETALIPVDAVGNVPDVCIIEMGGTVGDFEGLPFIEALRQLVFEENSRSRSDKNALVVNVSYIPVLAVSDEVKTKPTQNGVSKLRSLGLNLDILCVRCERELTDLARAKLSNFCQVPVNHVLMNSDVSNIYQIPILFDESGLYQICQEKLGLNSDSIKQPLHVWEKMANNLDRYDLPKLKIAIVGKYTGLGDSYLSLTHAIKHACMHEGAHPDIHFIESTLLERKELTELEVDNILGTMDVIIIPGGFGQRGIEGMIRAAHAARTRKIPCLGICLGFQVQVIEYGRNVLKLVDANSIEFDSECEHPVITIINPEEKRLGGTMRLGKEWVKIEPHSRVCQAYGGVEVEERHRHRYEVNPDYLEHLERKGLRFVARDLATGTKMEILELGEKDHPCYIGMQFHGEYLTRPQRGHPMFRTVIRAAVDRK